MHSRLAALISLLVLPVALGVAPGEPPDEARIQSHSKARAIIDRAIKVQGGETKIQKLRAMNVKFRCKIVVPEEGEFPFTLDVSWAMPDKYRSTMQIVIAGQPLHRVLVINGKEGWMHFNGKVRDLAQKELAEAREELHAELVCKLAVLRDTEYQLAVLDEIKLEGRSLQGVNVTRKGFRDVNLYFDKLTGLLVKMEHTITDTTTGKDFSQEIIFRDYRDTNGPKHWGKVIGYNDHQRIFEAEVAEIKFFDKVDEKLYTKPPGTPADNPDSKKDSSKSNAPKKNDAKQ